MSMPPVHLGREIAADGPSWRVEFAEWRSLSHDQRRRLLVVIGDCRGEWWGAGTAEFWSRQAALEAIGMAADDLPNVIKVIQDFSTFGSIPDRLQQGVLNMQWLARLLKDSGSPCIKGGRG